MNDHDFKTNKDANTTRAIWFIVGVVLWIVTVLVILWARKSTPPEAISNEALLLYIVFVVCGLFSFWWEINNAVETKRKHRGIVFLLWGYFFLLMAGYRLLVEVIILGWGGKLYHSLKTNT